ncbi:CDP-glycerol glycerophosphotransferase family protein [Erysipelothrix tonsillarum]|uniref:CDP-glycerol glycerophosphotransferase family protein n=1 Tax=Erysipelothrix tonsillarum TaxID=38402 RepID=UPI000368DCE2|nr:CDP-glycerol glycerophosphotransferase family protein [Erysipelothrix tonsillarum]
MKKIRKIRLKDILAIFKFLLAYPISKIYKLFRKDLWLFCENGLEGRDNAYWLFKYTNENLELDTVFVISERSPDYERVNQIGKTIEPFTLKHWIFYLTAIANISTHKGGKPNAAVCYILEVKLKMSNNRIFLQHGITLSDAKWLYYKNTNMSMFICASKAEFKFIEEKFGYPKDNLKLLGFSRFDTLPRQHSNNKDMSILIMPSWRNWLIKNPDVESVSEKETKKFIESEFYKKWNQFLNDERLKYYLDQGIEIKFFPHRNIQPFLSAFENNNGITMCDWRDYDIQEELKSNRILLTDYSSVFLDFSYMNKPVIYYQFDQREFREKQYQEGYFNYEKNGFGPVVTHKENVFSSLNKIIENNCELEKIYIDRIDDFFCYRDKNNSKRITSAILEFTQKEAVK